MSGIDHQEKRKEAKEKIKNIFVFSFFYIKQLKTCWKGQTMEDIKINNEKLNEAIKEKSLPEVPRTIEGKIDLEAITIEVDEKNNKIIPDEIFDSYYRELPSGIINKSKTWRTSNGGKIKIFGGDPEADKIIHQKGAATSNAAQAQRRSYRESVEFWNSKKVPKFMIEATEGRFEIPEDMSMQDAQVLAQQYKAIVREDTNAAQFLRDTAGEKPTDKIAAEVETITPEDRKQIERILNRTKTQDIVVGKDQE